MGSRAYPPEVVDEAPGVQEEQCVLGGGEDGIKSLYNNRLRKSAVACLVDGN